MSYARSLSCHTDINFNVTLRIIYVAVINVVHTLPLFKCKMRYAEVRTMLMRATYRKRQS